MVARIKKKVGAVMANLTAGTDLKPLALNLQSSLVVWDALSAARSKRISWKTLMLVATNSNISLLPHHDSIISGNAPISSSALDYTQKSITLA